MAARNLILVLGDQLTPDRGALANTLGMALHGDGGLMASKPSRERGAIVRWAERERERLIGA